MDSMIIAGVLIGLIATALCRIFGQCSSKRHSGAELRLRRRPLDRTHGARAVPAKADLASPPIPGEKIIGWIAHYALGAAFGFLPILLGGGAGWIANPTWLAAIGAACSLAVPFFIVVPAFGSALCARRILAARRQGRHRASVLRRRAVHRRGTRGDADALGTAILKTAWRTPHGTPAPGSNAVRLHDARPDQDQPHAHETPQARWAWAPIPSDRNGRSPATPASAPPSR